MIKQELMIELLEMSLYQKKKLEEYDSILDRTLNIDYSIKNKNIKLFCTKCNCNESHEPVEILGVTMYMVSSYKTIDSGPVIQKNIKDKEILVSEYKCTMCNETHNYIFKVLLNENIEILKIGETPSKSDKLKIDKKYKKFLKEEEENLKKAIMLNSFGYQKGAMVYLRTVYEKLILDLYMIDNDEGIEEFKKLKMKDKLKEIKEKLPEEFTSSEIYNIMSDDVHDFYSDYNGGESFEIIYEIIMMILEEKNILEEKEKRKKKLKIKLSQIQNQKND